jgi:hypothetical protein
MYINDETRYNRAGVFFSHRELPHRFAIGARALQRMLGG